MTFHRLCVDMALRLLVVPLLVRRLPDLLLATFATGERLINVVLRQRSVGIDVCQASRIRCNSGRVCLLLYRMQGCNSLSLRQLLRSWVLSSRTSMQHARSPIGCWLTTIICLNVTDAYSGCIPASLIFLPHAASCCLTKRSSSSGVLGLGCNPDSASF